MIERSAIVSSCGTWRYEWRRTWNIDLPIFVAWLLNPSTADAEKEDATSVRVWKRADQLGCGTAIIINLGAGCATNPKVWKAMPDPIGPLNGFHVLRVLKELHKRGGMCMAGWGTNGTFRQLDLWACKTAMIQQVILTCCGMTQSNSGRLQPKHPLYVPLKLKLVPYGS